MRIAIPNCEKFRKGCEEYERHEKRDAMYKIATFLVTHFWGQPSDMADGLGVLLLTWNQSFYRYGYFDFEKLEECIANNLQKIESFRSRDIASLSRSDENHIKDLFTKFLKALQIDVIRFSDKNKRKKYTDNNLKKILNELGIEFIGTNLKTLYKSMKNSKIGNAVEFVEDSKKDSIEIWISELDFQEKEKLKALDKKMKIIKKSPVSAAKALHLLAPKFFPLWDDKIARAYRCNYDTNPAEKYVSFCKITKIIAEKVKDYDIQTDRTLIKLVDEYNFSKYTKKWI